ncbi:reverse transcriptase domain-containing protein [Tanacetum coccineum]
MAPKRATRSTPVTTTPTPTATTIKSVTNAQLQAMIDQGVTTALAARDANKNGDDSHTSGTGTEGVVELTQWFERMETVFHISNCPVENQVILAVLSKKKTDKYCLRNEIEKARGLIIEFESEGKIGGLPDMIHGNIVASKPKTMQEAVEMDTELMDKKVITIAKRQAENKRKAYTAGTGEKKPYGGSKTLCAKCNYHHDDPRAPKCHKCNKVGHFARDCRSVGNANNANNQRGTGSGQKPTCFECEARRVEARRVENHTIFGKLSTINGFEKSLPQTVCLWTSQFLCLLSMMN